MRSKIAGNNKNEMIKVINRGREIAAYEICVVGENRLQRRARAKSDRKIYSTTYKGF